MSKIKYIAWMLALHGYAYSQPTIDFYRHYIPPLYLDSAQYQTALAANLQNAESTDPELVYDFLLCFSSENRLFDAAKYQNYLKEASIKKGARRAWALSEIRRLYSSPMDYTLKDLGISFYRGMVDSESVNPAYELPKEYEVNKRDFFVYRYYTKDSVSEYNPQVNYSDKRNRYESDVIDRYKDYCVQFTTDPDTTTCGRMVNAIPKLWYVFEKRTTFDSASFSPSTLVELYVTHKYSFEQELPALGFGVVFDQNNSSRIDMRLPDNPPTELSVRVPVIHNQYGISGFYRLQLKEIKSFLSYLKFEVTYLQNKSSYTYTPSLNQNQGYPVNDSVYSEYFVTTQRSSLTISSLSSFFFTVSTPLLYINKYILVEPSIGLAVNSISYAYDYAYTYDEYQIIQHYNIHLPQTALTGSWSYAGRIQSSSYVKYVLLASMNVSFNVYKNVYIQGNFGINNTAVTLQSYF